MGSRGRPSAADLAVTPTVETISVPEAPYDLTDEEAEVWQSLGLSIIQEFGRLPASVFPNVAEQCRHIVKSRHVHQLIVQAEKKDDLDVKEYDRLLKMAERESRGIATHSVKWRAMLREGSAKKKPLQVPPPWKT